MILTPTSIFQEKEVVAPAGPSLVIDDVGVDANYAWGLRKLRSAYTGDAVRVRRTSDNAEQDIGFNGEDFDTSALATFCGASKGYVRTIYDQSGNGATVEQTNASLQPLIYDGGVTTDDNGNNRPVIRSTEIGDTSSTGDYIMDTPSTFTALQKPVISYVHQYITHNPTGIASSDKGNGYGIGTYTNGATNNAVNFGNSAGNLLLAYGTITAGDSFGMVVYFNDDGGTNASTCIGCSDVGIGRGGAYSNNTSYWSCSGMNTPTYDTITLFYCCSGVLYQNMMFMEQIYWDLGGSNLSTTQSEILLDNINNYYGYQY